MGNLIAELFLEIDVPKLITCLLAAIGKNFLIDNWMNCSGIYVP